MSRVGQNLCLIVWDRQKFSLDMETFNISCPWDKHIFNQKKYRNGWKLTSYYSQIWYSACPKDKWIRKFFSCSDKPLPPPRY